MKKRIRIIGDGGTTMHYKVFLGDEDISNCVRGLKISMGVGAANTAELELVGIPVEVDGLFDVTAIGDVAYHFKPIKEGG